MIKINKYERFYATINHRKPDKMPLYIPTIYCSVASQILEHDANTGGDSLLFKLELAQLNGDNAYKELVNKVFEDTIELSRKLKIDIIRQPLLSIEKPTKKLDDYTLYFEKEDGSYKVKRFYSQYQSYGILEDTTGFRNVEHLKSNLMKKMKKIYKVNEDELNTIYHSQLQFKKLADPYFPTIVGGIGMGISMYNTVWLESIALEPEFLADYFMYLAEIGKQHIKWLYKHGFIWINGGGDLASNTGPIYSPNTFKNVFVNPLKIIADECRKVGMIYCYRTDGNIWSLFDYMFHDTGIQAYGEVDRQASMTVKKVRENASELIILGNISSSTLNKGTEEEVRDETRESLMESGGYNYIVGPSNAVLHGTPIQNVYAMIDEVEKFKPLNM